MSMFDHYDCLGGRSYYLSINNLQVYSSFANCINSDSKFLARIDPVAVLGILMKNYSIGNRTLVSGIELTPWMSRLTEEGKLQEATLPQHGINVVGADEASKKLRENLTAEVLDFVEGKKAIGILLSGGMDSRIVAGIVRLLQESGDFAGDVVALTWGVPESRDVIYAQRIACEFGWEFKHFELNAERLKDNIELAAVRGAEYSPVHLHAMESVANTEGIDGILAGSYGDSIGRGEYSGRRAHKLPAILDKHQHHFSFLLKGVEKDALKGVKQDLASARQRFPGRTESAYREIEMQMHYMRRQLNSCMNVIDDNIPLYQMFSSPETFGYMWSLAPECRTDDIYDHLLKRLPDVLQKIPWARTGKKYNQNSMIIEDTNTALNNHYGLWLRNDLRSHILDLVNNGALQSLGIFNELSLKMWSSYWPTTSLSKADRLDEKMAWLASLSLFVSKYNIQPYEKTISSGIDDVFSIAKSYIHTRFYHEALKWKR